MDLKVALDILLQVAMAITLAAATGLRAFLPIFLLSLAAHFFHLPLIPQLQFLADERAVVVFGLATLIEILGDKIPAVDHFLDTVQSFIKPFLGVLASAAVLSKVDPLLALVIAIALTGTFTVPTHVIKGGSRLISSTTTGGIANPLLSLGEDLLTIALVIMGIFLPLLAIGLIGVLAIITFRKLRGKHQSSQSLPSS